MNVWFQARITTIYAKTVEKEKLSICLILKEDVEIQNLKYPIALFMTIIICVLSVELLIS